MNKINYLTDEQKEIYLILLGWKFAFSFSDGRSYWYKPNEKYPCSIKMAFEYSKNN